MKCLWCKTEMQDLFSLNRGFGKPNLLVQGCDKLCSKAILIWEDCKRILYPENYVDEIKEPKVSEIIINMNNSYPTEHTQEELDFWNWNFNNSLPNLFREKESKVVELPNLFEKELVVLPPLF